MQIDRCELVGLDEVDSQRPVVEDVVVVIDVIRAFTTAVAAFEAGAAELRCVAGLDEARTLAAGLPGARLIGEEHGKRPDGFDGGNSPVDLEALDLSGRTVVQRTTNGTRGLARFATAPILLAAAAVNAPATAAWIRARDPRSVLLVGTGLLPEDLACAAFIAELVSGRQPDPDGLAAAVWATGADHRAGWSRARPDHAAAFDRDLAACAAVGTSDLVLRGRPLDTAVVLSASG